MKRKPYPAYKPSGVEWLGEIPEHWSAFRLKHAFWLQRGHDLPVTEFCEGEYPVCGSNGRIGYHNQFTTKGPGVTIGRSGSVGEINYIDMNYWAHNTALYVKEFYGTIPRYIFYLLKTLDVRYLSEGTAVGTLNRNYIHDLLIGIPAAKEQQAIAAFLDRETSRIDELIARKQRQIELLQEKRSALISHVVTKGLDPNVKMKDSGIEWLGEIPEHWRQLAIKRLTIVKRGASPRPIDDPQYFDEDGEYSWVRIADVTASDRYLEATTQRLSPLGKSLSVPLKPGDLFLSIAGTVGKPIITRIKCCIHDGFVYFPQYKEDKHFLYYIFASGQPYQGLGKWGTQLNLNTDTVGWIQVALPSIEEQHFIAAFLDREISRIDELIGKVNKSINLLREYRTALISAAVTGKIDVREEALAS